MAISQDVKEDADGTVHVVVDNVGGVEVSQATHDNLNANANIQVGDADVDNGNPVPISDAGGSITVDAVNLDIRDLSSGSDSVSAVVTSSVLPTGAATEATLAALSAKLSPATPALTQVAQNAASVSILASSGTRKGFIIVNDAPAILYLAFGATATTSAYTAKLQPNSVYTSPLWVYTGAISGIWASAGAGAAVITSVS